MTSPQAFDKIEEMIMDIKTTYVPQHGGELWERAYYLEQGFSEGQIQILYEIFHKILTSKKLPSPNGIDNQRKLFSQLVESFS